MSEMKDKKNHRTLWESAVSRRQTLSRGVQAAAVVSLGTLFYPLQSVATVFNAGTFWRKKYGRQLWAWGQNTYGQLGVGNNTNRSSPIQIGSLSDWSKIAGGELHGLAIRSDGTLWTWGYNTRGQLGDSTVVAKSSPIQIGSLKTWTQISAGRYHSLALRSDGTIWNWGGNYNGATLGQPGVWTNISSPVQVGNLSTWSKIAAGYYHNTAIKSDGTLWTWGSNFYGELGIGTNGSTDKSSPVQVGALTDWTQITCGCGHNIAIRSGTLWAWGANDRGQLGIGDRSNRSSPIQIGALNTWAKVIAGYAHNLALKTDGTLWAWGRNEAGQLGDGTIVDKSSPVQIGALNTWVQVHAGMAFSLALKNDGTLWAWGSSSVGQLGDSTIVSKSSPIQIGSLKTWAEIAIAGGDGETAYVLKKN